ncbi:multicopper oxidase domain-containing protein [Parapedobacter koreensis]|uniref:Multicopper oxidase with three cupredoxin domains (Includes cell division protein FtsP and spore coat protein CotA) n=1 Tax=Parapedobacter koreensis TaxID=332977 RepID=A0A1H7MV84_9SPHI|nr:multicopper oxidase domain-containing protein [Parapedobacter koreensis]SEL14517.1 Multicopper oxidase with three cupredoxin domains (includes cell division protein FtsP and spore coat protein CotA) [Parapedobacter koreensis]
MKVLRHIGYLTLLLASASTAFAQRTVRYDLSITDTVVNYTGKPRKAIAINGQLPAPALHFTEGDTAEIHVHNHMHHETSIHWHGLLLPNEQDGVPYLTTAPILPMSTHIYRFPIRQSGTYWYHSHTMLQEQVGMYGAFIIHKRGEQTANEEVMLLSDWSDENPHQIERSLHRATDWYGIQKRATQNYGEGLLSGHFGTKLANEWKRMHAMDVSDVYYERFLVNGRTAQQAKYRKGDKVRVRIINGSSSTYFWLTYAGGPITVVASDGADVEPVTVDRLIIGVSETYDVEVSVPADGTAYELVATSEDRMGQASLWLGDGVKQLKQPLGRLDYFEGMKMMNGMMTVGGNMKDMGMNMSLQQMDMNAVMYPEGTQPLTLNYAMLRSPSPTTLPNKPFRTLHFELTGNMNRYVWTMDNKTVSESDKILIRKGENIRIVLTNNSMMRHPMHLHGHFFRVVNGQGDHAPLKNVLDIMPMETDTLELHADEAYGDWFFHCHILYHMMSGMGRIFSYEDSPPNPQIPNPERALRIVYADDRRFYLGAEISIESNASDGDVALENTRWAWQTDWHLGPNNRRGYEVDTRFGRYIDRNQFLIAFAGWEWRYREGGHADHNWFGQVNTKDDRDAFHIGVQYTLPWFIVADLRVNHNGYVRLQIQRDDIPVTARLRLRGMYNSDREYTVGAKYILTKYLALSSHYDSDMGWGGGLTFMY